MRSLLRALVVIAAVTLAGTAVTGTHIPAQHSAAAPEPAPTPPTPTAATKSPAATPASPKSPAAPAPSPTSPPRRQLPLAGVTVALDPGHQLGNSNFPARVNAPVDGGGFQKPCNTTGTATEGGLAEATVVWQVAREVRRRLERLGAEVRLTRTANSARRWGPCVDERGRFGAVVGAQLMVSLHADGSTAGGRGFHVIAPASRDPWTTDIAEGSRRLATHLRDGLEAQGLPRSTYIGEGSGLDVRADLGTLNLSDVPVAMVELGNMREPGDAARMASATGRTAYAEGIVRGVRAHLEN